MQGSPSLVPVWALIEHTGSVRSLAISSDGRMGLSGSYPAGCATARRRDLETGASSATSNKRHAYKVFAVAWSPARGIGRAGVFVCSPGGQTGLIRLVFSPCSSRMWCQTRSMIRRGSSIPRR